MVHTIDTAPLAHSRNKKLDFLSLAWSGDARYYSLVFLTIILWAVGANIVAALLPDSVITSSQRGVHWLRQASVFALVFIAYYGLYVIYLSRKTLTNLSEFKNFAASIRKNPYSLMRPPLMGALGLISIAGFFFAYSTIKTRIPAFTEYSWDVAFYKLDQVLFFGNDPWKVFAFLYDFPIVIKSLDTLYSVIWPIILFGSWVTCFASKRHSVQRRMQYCLAILISWFIGGNLLAVVFASVGPVYFTEFTGLASPYVEQMQILASINETQTLGAFTYQEYLLDVYKSGSYGLGGISAMPSMHITTAILFIFMFGQNIIMRSLLIAFAVIIYFTSFILAWHYAVDGLLSVPIAIGGWYLSGWVLRYFTSRSAIANT